MKQQTKKQNKIEWREVELRGITSLIMGQAPPSKSYNLNGEGVPFVKVSEFGGVYPGKKVWTTEPQKMAKEGDVLICVVGSIGKVNKSISCAIGRSVAAIRPDKKFLNQDFLFHFVSLITKKITSMSQGTTQGVIGKEHINSIKIPLPFSNGQSDLKEQERIVKILDKAESLKQKGKHTERLLDEYLKSVFYEMFYNRGFEEVKLGDKKYFEITMGQSPAGASYNKIGKGTPFFQGKKEFGEKYPSVEQWTTEPSKLAKPNDILISVRAPVGSINLANIQCCIGRGLASIRCKEEIKMDFVYSLLKVKEKEIENLGNGSTFKAITSGQLLGIKIPLPSQHFQQKFSSIVKQVEKMKEEIKKTQKNSEDLFNSLMQKAFRGEL